MAALDWADPLPSTSTVSSSTSSAVPDFLDTLEGELSFFRALVHHRLVGPDKHWHMLGIVQNIKHHNPKESTAVTAEQLWAKYRQSYDEDVLHKTWEEQQESYMEDETEPPPDDDSSSTSSTSIVSRITARIFPKRDFSLAPEEPLAIQAFERGRLPPDEPPQSPPDAPLREVEYELPAGEGAEEDEDKKPALKSPRKRAGADKVSPRKKKAKTAAGLDEEGSGSELSELTDQDDDEEEEGDDDEGESEEAEADSVLEEGTTPSRIDEEEEAEEEPASKGKRRAPTAASRGPPSSKRTRNARSASVATSDSRTAAERKKDQSTPAAATRSSKSRATNSGRKAPPKKRK
ncbi:hypothetical protein JCM1840_001899 [Sporobolomyces johnsonii]